MDPESAPTVAQLRELSQYLRDRSEEIMSGAAELSARSSQLIHESRALCGHTTSNRATGRGTRLKPTTLSD
jgi:hypothetical protein